MVFNKKSNSYINTDNKSKKKRMAECRNSPMKGNNLKSLLLLTFLLFIQSNHYVYPSIRIEGPTKNKMKIKK